MLGYIAPARRVGFYLGENGAASLTNEGDTLLQNSFCWLMKNCPTTNTLTVDQLSGASFCPGDTIIIDYTAVGDFAGTDLLANSNEIIVSETDAFRVNKPFGSLANHGWEGKGAGVDDEYPPNAFIQTIHSAKGPNSFIRYRIPIEYSGQYSISLWTPNEGTFTFSNGVPVEITHDGGIDTIYIDQRVGGNNWKKIGTQYYFTKEQGVEVKILTQGAFGVVSDNIAADAIKITPLTLDVLPSPSVIIAELSNNLGGFSGLITEIGLDTVTISGSNSREIRAVLPLDAQPGTNYKVRLTASSPAMKGDPSVQSFEIKGLPIDAGPIFGNSEICFGDNVQSFSLNPHPDAVAYFWDAPTETVIQGSKGPKYYKDTLTTTSTSMTVDLTEVMGVRFDAIIKAKVLTSCGLSRNFSYFEIDATYRIPDTVQAVLGDSTVCRNGNYTFSVPSAARADKYVWTYPSWMTLSAPDDSTNQLKVMIGNVPDGTTGIITSYSLNDCGSTPPASFTVRVDNISNQPIIDTIEGLQDICIGGEHNYIMRDPIVNATYNWTWPAGAILTSTQDDENVISFKYPIELEDSLKIEATNFCGTASKAIPIKVNGRTTELKAIIAVGDSSNITGNDIWMKTRLETLGYTVDYMDDEDELAYDFNCTYSLAIISATTVRNQISRKFSDVLVPVIINNADVAEFMWLLDGVSVQNNRKNLRIDDNTHPVAEGMSNGQLYDVYTANGFISLGIVWPSSNNDVRRIASRDDRSTYQFITYEKNDTMIDGAVAADRRMLFFLGDNNATLTPIGVNLFDRSICWASGTCGDPEIETQPLSYDRYCYLQDIDIVYTVSSPFASGNIFTAQLSNSNGDFSNPIILGTSTAQNSGVISASIPSDLDVEAGSGYRVRVVGSDPAIDGLDNGTNIVIGLCNSLDTLAGPDTVCQAMRETYQVSPLPDAKRYDWSITPSGPTFTSSVTDTNSIGVEFSGAINLANYTIKVVAYDENNNELDSISKTIVVNENDAKPKTASIIGASEFCPGGTGEFVALAPQKGNATYKWTMTPATVSLVENFDKDTVVATFVDSYTGVLSLNMVNACGDGPVTSKNISAQEIDTVILVVGDKNNITGNDLRFKQQLETSQGYKVKVLSDEDDVPSNIDCYKGIVITPTVDETVGGSKYIDAAIPAMVSNNLLYDMRLVSEESDESTRSGKSEYRFMDILDNSHKALAGYSGSNIQVIATSTPEAQVIFGGAQWESNVLNAHIYGDVRDRKNLMQFSYKKGDLMGKPSDGYYEAPAPRGNFFLVNNTIELTAAGWNIFDQLFQCELMNECDPEVTVLPINPTCNGEAVDIFFSTNIDFTTGNNFRVQVSDANGSFASPLKDSLFAGISSGNLALALNIPAGTGYKVRMLATNPSYTSEAVDLVINSCSGIDTLLGADTVCQALNSVYSVNPLLANVSYYDWILPSEIKAVGATDERSITLDFVGTTDGNQYTVKVVAYDASFAKLDSMTKVILINNTQSIPMLDSLTGTQIGLLNGNGNYTAYYSGSTVVNYNWNVPASYDAVLDRGKDFMVDFTLMVDDTMSVTVSNACGVSPELKLPVEIIDPDNDTILFISGNGSSPNAADGLIIDRMRSLGHIVQVIDDGAPYISNPELKYNLIWISESINTGSNGAKLSQYWDAPIPLINQKYFFSDDLNMIKSADRGYTEGSGGDEDIIVTDETHPVMRGFTNGQTVRVNNKRGSVQGLIQKRANVYADATYFI